MGGNLICSLTSLISFRPHRPNTASLSTHILPPIPLTPSSTPTLSHSLPLFPKPYFLSSFTPRHFHYSSFTLLPSFISFTSTYLHSFLYPLPSLPHFLPLFLSTTRILPLRNTFPSLIFFPPSLPVPPSFSHSCSPCITHLLFFLPLYRREVLFYHHRPTIQAPSASLKRRNK